MPHTSRATAGPPEVRVRRLVALECPPPDINETLLTISEDCVGCRAVLSVTGEIDISNAADLLAAIESAAPRAFELWLDLSAVTFMDSSGLHAIAKARVRLIEANTRLTLICPEGPVLRVLALTGFDQVVEIRASRSAANHATLA